MTTCPHGHDIAVVGRDERSRCRGCQRRSHERTAARRLIERRSKRKARTERDLARLEEMGWLS